MGRGRPRPLYVCRACGAAAARRVGRCPDCGEWDGLAGRTQPALGPRALHAPAARPLAAPSAAFGEIDLAGAVRPVGHAERRLTAGAAAGLGTAITPPPADTDRPLNGSTTAVEVATIAQALDAAFAA